VGVSFAIILGDKTQRNRAEMNCSSKTGPHEKQTRGQHHTYPGFNVPNEGSFSKQIFNEAALKMGTMYNTPVPHCFKQKFFCGTPPTPKARNAFQTPRFTESPWRGATQESVRPNLCTIDNTARTPAARHNFQEAASEDKQSAPPNKPEILRQTTIIWQDIHPNAESPTLIEKRRKALKAALKSRKDRRHRREKEFSARIKRAPATTPNSPESVEDMAWKQSAKFPSRAHSDDLNWCRRHKEVRLASISNQGLTLNRPKARAKTVFVNFTIPAASAGNKTILPSLHKLV